MLGNEHSMLPPQLECQGALCSWPLLAARSWPSFQLCTKVLLILIAMVGFSSFVSAYLTQGRLFDEKQVCEGSITASMTRLRSLQGNELSEAFLLRRLGTRLGVLPPRWAPGQVPQGEPDLGRPAVRSLWLLRSIYAASQAQVEGGSLHRHGHGGNGGPRKL